MNINALIKDIDQLIKSGDWCTFAPKFQTWADLFHREDLHWIELRDDFIAKATRDIGQKPKLVRAWCYANYAGIPQEEWPLWHIHGRSQEDGESRICGVMYLTQGELGTMFKKDGKIFYAPSTVGVWYFFDPDEEHSPPKWDPDKKQNRYCIAAEALY